MNAAVLSIYIGRERRQFDLHANFDIAQAGMEIARHMPVLEHEGRVAVTLTRGNLIRIIRVTR